MKKTKICSIIAIMFMMLISLTTITNASSDYLFLNNLEFDVQIQKDGSMVVTEIWDIDIEETNTLYKTFELDETRYSGITDVEVREITTTGKKEFTQIYEEMYHVTKDCYYGIINKNGMFEIAWGVGLDNDYDTRKYEIKYTVQDAIGKYNDYAELYWQFVGEDFEIDARKIKGTIKLPQRAMSKDEIKVWGHTEDLNGEIYVTNTDTIEFEVYGRNSGNFVEVRTLFPTEMISYSGREYNSERLQEVINEETIWAEEANARRKEEMLIKNIVSIIEAIIAAIFCIVLIRSILKQNKKLKQMVKFKPTQEWKYFREIPREDATPAESIYIIKERKMNIDDSFELGKVFSATLLDLSLKKYISFEICKDEKGKENIKIKLEKQVVEEDFPKDESAVFLFIKEACKKQNEITVKELEKYIGNKQTKVISLKETIDKNRNKELLNKELVNKKEMDEYDKYTAKILGIIVAIVVTIITGIVTIIGFSPIAFLGIGPLVILEIIYLIILCKIQGKINVYTQKGIDEVAQWKGLKKYMEEFSLLKEKEVPQLVLWEKFLVYATVFGIAEKVLKQLKIVYPNMEETVDMNNYACLYFATHSNFTTSFSNAISTSMSSSYSSGTGGGGGFSGGGGGGRWPEVAVEVDKTDDLFHNT